jgi:ATP-dependent DNA helicase MPH1
LYANVFLGASPINADFTVVQLTGCITACHDYLLEAQKADEDQQAENKKAKPMWIEDQSFKAIMLKLKTIQEAGGAPHPKMEKLKDILIDYFGARMQDPNPEGGPTGDATCVIVFSSFRAVVEEIVSELAGHAPLIRAAAFVGQATDKKGRKGLTQKGQHQVGPPQVLKCA